MTGVDLRGTCNNGFAVEWIHARSNDAKPAAGQPWSYYEIDAELAASPPVRRELAASLTTRAGTRFG